MTTTFFCADDVSKAKVLVIGHDPRLQVSHTLADCAFFADYFFKPIPTRKSERAKYELAEAVFGYISYLTSYKYLANQIVLTNLCNTALPHAPKGKTVYIPEAEARNGISAIQAILSRSRVDVVFAMSAQVNYWLQKLEFYPVVAEFLSYAEPRAKGVTHTPPYYEATRSRAFTHICGQRYTMKNNGSIIPILHIKNWPLRGAFAKAYSKAYEACVNALK
jgi:hypothetical protein